VSVLFDLAADLNRTRDPALARQLKGLGAVLGFFGSEPHVFLQSTRTHDPKAVLSVEAIEARVARRYAAKRAKNFTEADKIRAELLASGVILEDKPGGVTEWRRI
jgi:cysteinyl-tRNA synthetase